MILKNNDITIEIDAFGAELKSIKNKNNEEYIWQRNPDFWAKSSPILFPIVGSLINNTYQFNGQNFSLSRHGFARDMIFLENKISESKVVYELNYTEETLKKYPFYFNLQVVYEIIDNELTCTYFVKNNGDFDMYFSLGAHPAFSFENVDLNQYTLHLKNDSVLNRVLLHNGLLSNKTEKMVLNNNTLHLNYNLFSKDALVFRDLKSEEIILKNSKNQQRIKFKFSGYSHFGIWSATNANFVCLEPWCGVADNENHNQNFTQKEGIIKLDANKTFEISWSVEVF